MRHLANIDVAKLSSGVLNDINRVDQTFSGKEALYYHYLFEPAEFCEQLDFFVRTGYKIITDDPLMTLLSKSAIYEDKDCNEFAWTEYAIIYKKFGIVFYTDWEEQTSRYPSYVANAVLEYLENENTNNGWI